MAPPSASRVVLSYPDGLGGWGSRQIETDRFRGYFRRVLGAVAVGETREAFVDVGCCGDSLDVPFRVVRIEVDGASVDAALVDDRTEIAYETHAGDVSGGWRVQSADGPSR